MSERLFQGALMGLKLADWQENSDVSTPWQLFCNEIVEAVSKCTDFRLLQYPDLECETRRKSTEPTAYSDALDA